MNITQKLSRKSAPDMTHSPYRWMMGNTVCGVAKSRNGGIFTEYLF